MVLSLLFANRVVELVGPLAHGIDGGWKLGFEVRVLSGRPVILVSYICPPHFIVEVVSSSFLVL